MVIPILPPKGGIPYLSNTPSKSAIQRFVCQIEVQQSGPPLTIYTLHREFTKAERDMVLADLRLIYPCTTISAVGCEIAVFAPYVPIG